MLLRHLLDAHFVFFAVTPDYFGYHCPNKFVVGYGMDFNRARESLETSCLRIPTAVLLAEQYRALPFIGVLKPDAYKKKE